MSERLTTRQQEILDFIRLTQQEEGRPPTRAEICTAFGFKSPNAAETHLRALAAKGVITVDNGRARGIRLTEAAGLPLIGRVAAGSPLLAQEHVERHHPINPELFSPRADYLLRVRGLSMRDAGILDGDLLAVHRTSEARNGQIVVARIDDDVTVKRYQRHGSVIELIAENPDFEPIRVEAGVGDFQIEGLAVGLIRTDGIG
ncbi:transcriptional repressor LexA [Nitrogeniibacter mangrovi]|uniref:LexA repressor n=1 Tax=Nitrogeniibacter mangrovi TaxID=2016596 RepID=A0A6C1B4Z2_9RHOO|nr:transcriptional repressor LexA [Nitrogeniibacter mangrovi]QID18069.1 transcriptional repressor LexA [Nitrogeniibacter mangrovi]